MKRILWVWGVVLSVMSVQAQDPGKNVVGTMIDDSIRVNGQNRITSRHAEYRFAPDQQHQY